MKRSNPTKALCFSILTLLLIPIAQGAANGSGPVFNETAFNQNAALYGNKTANLIELKKIADYLNSLQSSKMFEVPTFFGLSSLDIITYLQQKPYEQTNAWDYILSQWRLFTVNQEKDAPTLTDAARTALEHIRVCLSEIDFDIKQIANKQSTEFETFFENAVQQHKLLMVRSTGREDGKELSNAGGNASIASVAPAPEALSMAISEVLRSYFSEKSIMQRLLGNDANLFESPFMAVLLQIMTGETYGIDTEIPKSGVMFSPEAEGETPDVVVIQTTFGHNEGVVNGLVPVDTYYIGPSGIIHPLISIKSKRLAAKPGKAGLDFVENDKSLQSESTLDRALIHALKDAAQFIQQYYANSVDIEFVITNNIIHFVQVRPLEDKKFKASYLKTDFINQADLALPVYPIGVGDASVRTISTSDQVIITDNIRQALDTFLFKTNDQKGIKAVIINESAPATSHEATQFRRLGIPVLYIQDLQPIRSQLNELPGQSATAHTHKTLVIDAQRALIIPFAPSDLFDSPESIIESGWYSHPIAKKVSIMPEFIEKLAADELQKLTPEEFFSTIPTSALIDIIKQESPETAHKGLLSLLHRVLSTLRRTEAIQKNLTLTQPKLSAQLKLIFLNMLVCAHEIDEILMKPNVTRLERLYPVIFLEALLKQIPEPQRLVNDYSFSSLLKTELQEQKIVQELTLRSSPERERIVQYAKAAEFALVPQLKHGWNSFLQQLSSINNPHLQNNMARMLLNIGQLDILPLWLNTSFAQAYAAQSNDAEKTAQALLEEFEKASDFIESLQKLQQFFSTFNNSTFEDPGVFTKQFDIFKAQIESMINPAFISSLEAENNLNRTAALQIMHKAVDTFDKSIKALTGSNMYADDLLKVQRFQIMLKEYFLLLRSWSMIKEISADLNNMLDDANFSNIENYLQTISRALANASITAGQLKPSVGFNVSGAALASKANWNRSVPNAMTLEDIFSLTHQNLLVTLGLMARQTDLENISVPETVQTLKNAAKDFKIITGMVDYTIPIYSRAGLVGIDLNKDTLTYYYNIPIALHSNTFQIIYDLKHNTTKLAVQFIGGDDWEHNNRWRKAAGLARLLAKINNTPMEKPAAYDPLREVLNFTWTISTPDQANKAMQYLQVMAARTARYFDRDDRRGYFEKIAAIANMSIEDLVQEILQATTTAPELLLEFFEINDQLGRAHPLALGMYDKIFTLFPSLYPDLQELILRKFVFFLTETAYDMPTSSIFTFIKNTALNTDLFNKYQEYLGSILKSIIQEIPTQDALALTKILLSTEITQRQLLGLELLNILMLRSDSRTEELIPYCNAIIDRFTNNSTPAIQNEILKIASFLIAQNRLDNEALIYPILETKIFSNTTSIDKTVEQILANLIKNGKMLPEIKNLVDKKITTGTIDEQALALNILKNLVRKGHYQDYAMTILELLQIRQNLLSISDFQIRDSLISLNQNQKTLLKELLAQILPPISPEEARKWAKLIVEKIGNDDSEFEYVLTTLLQDEGTVPIFLAVLDKINETNDTMMAYNALGLKRMDRDWNEVSRLLPIIPYMNRTQLLQTKAMVEEVGDAPSMRNLSGQIMNAIDQQLNSE